MNHKTILSLEQALALPYCTQRFVQLGWRVIRIESPPAKENKSDFSKKSDVSSKADASKSRAGDPNRYIGNYIGFDDIHSYFVAPNVGKEAITLNLKDDKGKEILLRLIKNLNVDIFMCNTLPKRYKELGIDFESLRTANPNLIWCGISAFGPDYPNTAGYDPALQAMLGCMHLTGEPDRDPMLCGIPIVDLKAGDEAFIQVILALAQTSDFLEKADVSAGSKGREIFISMARCFSSWLITSLPELTLNPGEADKFMRSGNEHRSFIPCNCYPTIDGFVYLAIGSDSQWEKLTKIEGFGHIAKPERKTNAGRKKDKNNIYADIRQGTKLYDTDSILKIFRENNLAAAPVNTIPDVANLEFVKKNMLKTRLSNNNFFKQEIGNKYEGKFVELYPSPVDTEFLKKQNLELSFPHRLGEDNDEIYGEIGMSSEEIEDLREGGII